MKPGDLLLCLDWQWLYTDPFSGAANVKVLEGHVVLVLHTWTPSLKLNSIRSLVLAPSGLGYVHLDAAEGRGWEQVGG